MAISSVDPRWKTVATLLLGASVPMGGQQAIELVALGLPDSRSVGTEEYVASWTLLIVWIWLGVIGFGGMRTDQIPSIRARIFGVILLALLFFMT